MPQWAVADASSVPEWLTVPTSGVLPYADATEPQSTTFPLTVSTRGLPAADQPYQASLPLRVDTADGSDVRDVSVLLFVSSVDGVRPCPAGEMYG